MSKKISDGKRAVGCVMLIVTLIWWAATAGIVGALFFGADRGRQIGNMRIFPDQSAVESSTHEAGILIACGFWGVLVPACAYAAVMILLLILRAVAD